MMRSVDYARTAPEAQEGFPVFVVGFALIMAGTIWAAPIAVNGLCKALSASTRLNSTPGSRHKRFP
jgi:hypothetical protein